MQHFVDDADGTGVTVTGTWTTDTATAGAYRASSLHDGNAGKGSKSVQFATTLPHGGSYEVYIRHPTDLAASTSVPISVVHAGGTAALAVDQSVSGGRWRVIGRYNFVAGASLPLPRSPRALAQRPLSRCAALRCTVRHRRASQRHHLQRRHLWPRVC